MHGTIRDERNPAATTEASVIDPVCRMVIDPASAAASEIVNGKPVYFCSDGCRRRFLANPAAYAVADARDGQQCCSVSDAHDQRRSRSPLMVVPIGAGLLASVMLLSVYFGGLGMLSGWQFTVEQFADWWPYIVTLAVGFGVQVGLYVYLRRGIHGPASGKVVVATGTASGAAMMACCTHYLVNLLPVLGATGLVSFVGAYQVELFWFGITSNLAGIVYIGRRAFSISKGA